ncbi:M48 family metallopeptidase [Candidatus Wolfebacteria bacterium]|nr:M48 family metallopeptidase [Candidatus Wolfebacteria bacterium]
MASLYSEQSKNVQKTWFLMITFALVVIGVGWFFSYYLDAQGILFIAVAFALTMNVGSYWFSDKIALSMNGARPVTRKTHFDLWNITENLSIAAGLPMPKLYVIEDAAPNAFATGRDEKHAVVAVSTGLLNMLEKSELEGVIAHELSHIKNKDMLVMTVTVVLLGFITILADIFIRMTLYGGFRGNNDSKAGLVIGLVGIVFAILAPITAQLIHLAISRKREFLADASAGLMTRYPEGLASALEKIGAYKQPMKRANNATAHLFISNPFGSAKRGKRLSKLFSTHPPMEDRVNALRG